MRIISHETNSLVRVSKKKSRFFFGASRVSRRRFIYGLAAVAALFLASRFPRSNRLGPAPRLPVPSEPRALSSSSTSTQPALASELPPLLRKIVWLRLWALGLPDVLSAARGSGLGTIISCACRLACGSPGAIECLRDRALHPIFPLIYIPTSSCLAGIPSWKGLLRRSGLCDRVQQHRGLDLGPSCCVRLA
jgi:hypothetical protein